jgi:hypothetical protein
MTERFDHVDVSLVVQMSYLAHHEETASTQPRVGVMGVAARRVIVLLAVDGEPDERD